MKKIQLLLTVVILVLFGCMGRDAIREHSSYPGTSADGVAKVLLGVFLFWRAQKNRWSPPVSVRSFAKMSGIVLAGMIIFSYALATPCDVIHPLIVRMVLALAVLVVCQGVFGKWPKDLRDWVRLTGRGFLLFLFLCLVIQSGRYGWVPFHRLQMKFINLATVNIAELLAWLFVLVIAWFAWWLAEKPDDRRRIVGYWGVIAVCCACALSWYLPGIAAVLFGAGMTGALVTAVPAADKRNRRLFVLHAVCSVGVILLAFGTVSFVYPEGLARFQGFIQSEAQRFERGYAYAQLDRLITRISFWEGIPDAFKNGLPLPDSWRGYFLITVAALWGWGAVVFFGVVSAWLCWLLIDGSRRIHSVASRATASVLTTVLILQIVYGILQNWGWLPMLHIRQPFSEQMTLPFCFNALCLGLLLRLLDSNKAEPERVLVWPFLVIPMLSVALGGGLYTWRRVERQTYEQTLTMHKKDGLRQSIFALNEMLDDISKSGKLGEYGVWHEEEIKPRSILTDRIHNMVLCYADIGQDNQALILLHRAMEIVRPFVQGDSPIMMRLLMDDAGCLDRLGLFNASQPVYEKYAAMCLRLKQREDPSIKQRTVYVTETCWATKMQEGDIILLCEGCPVVDAQQLTDRIRFEKKKNTELNLIVLRNGREIDVHVPFKGRFKNEWLALTTEELKKTVLCD